MIFSVQIISDTGHTQLELKVTLRSRTRAFNMHLLNLWVNVSSRDNPIKPP